MSTPTPMSIRRRAWWFALFVLVLFVVPGLAAASPADTPAAPLRHWPAWAGGLLLALALLPPRPPTPPDERDGDDAGSG